MNRLTPAQGQLVASVTERLAAIHGVKAVVLGGSYARGRARPESDIDLGVFYSEAQPFSINSIRKLAAEVNDTPDPVVTDFYGWGPWVNGGAWLTIRGQRVDFIYRSIEHVERVIAEAEAGRHQVDYAQQPPFGFFSGTYLGEIAICVPQFDPHRQIAGLKNRVAIYPEALRRNLVQDYLWRVEFGLNAFALKFATRSDAYGTAACLACAVNQLGIVLFALNRRYPINDKTVLAEIAEFEITPENFSVRVGETFEHLGSSSGELASAVEDIARLFRETASLASDLYQPRFALPK